MMSMVKQHISWKTSKFWDNQIKDTSIYYSPIFIYKHIILLVELLFRRGNLLDIGFGYGYLEQKFRLLRFFYTLYGIDISSYAVKQLSKLRIGNFVRDSINTMSFKNNHFDVILVLDVFEHLDKKEVFVGFNKISKIIKKSGRLIISVPLNESLDDKIKNCHVNQFTEHEIIELCLKYKFALKRKYHLVAYPRLFLLKNLINYYIQRNKPNLLILILNKK